MTDETLLLQTILKKLESLDDKYENIITNQNISNVTIENLKVKVELYNSRVCPANSKGIIDIVDNRLAQKGISGETERRGKTKDFLVMASIVVTFLFSVYNYFVNIKI